MHALEYPGILENHFHLVFPPGRGVCQENTKLCRVNLGHHIDGRTYSGLTRDSPEVGIVSATPGPE